MKIIMKAYYLKTIFDACKNYIADKNYTQRPILQTVQLTCADGFCTAYALDGVKMITLTVPYVDGDAGAMSIPIIKLPKANFVTLSDEGNEIVFDFGDSKQTVRKYEGKYPENLDQLFPEKEPLLTIGFNPQKLKDALDSFKGSKAVELNFFGPRDACVIRGEGKKAIVLPVKL